jgi:Uma2 family endonuclease
MMRLPPVDERIVAPESRAEILEGRLIFAPPAEEKHAVPHADLAYVLRAHVKPEFKVAVDMLTRTSTENDFAPDASVYEAARDEETGGRKLEQLAFEIVNEQALSTQTTKARELTKRGVRRVFVLVVKKKRFLEWSRETDAWAATPLETIDDPCFVRPLPVNAVVKDEKKGSG